MLKSNTEIAVRMMRKLSRRLREVTAMLEEALGRRLSEEEKPVQRKPPPERNACRLVGEEPASEFFLNREGDTLVGRSDPVTGITPDVDLTPLDPQRSTSRRHAKLYQMGDTLLRHGRDRRDERDLRQRHPARDGGSGGRRQR